MIIGYDFWLDDVFAKSEINGVIIEDNDGVAFDTCNGVGSVDDFTLKNGMFDEMYVAKTFDDAIGVLENTEKQNNWSTNTVLLAKFADNLIGGTIGIDKYAINQIEVRKRKRGEDQWQTYYTIDYYDDINLYTIIDKFIENEETYEYCIRPLASNIVGMDTIVGTDSLPHSAHISYDHAHIFDNTASFDLIYNLKIGAISQNIGATVINTLASEYPYVIYSQDNYAQGSIDCLLVSEESATGMVDIKSEKALRNSILSFLCNRQYKILKNADGLYMLIKIIDTPTLTASDEVLGIYNLSFNYVEVGNANNIEDLLSARFSFDYLTKTLTIDEQGNEEVIIREQAKEIG